MRAGDGEPLMLSRRGMLTSAFGMIGAAIVLPGCGAEPAAPPRGPASSDIRIGLTEWAVSVPSVVAVAGSVGLTVTNAGASRHRLVAEGEGGQWVSPLLDPGEVAEMEILTVAGEVIALGCDVEGHDAHGVAAALRVEE